MSRVLYISPVTPSLSGGGRQVRAYSSLKKLASTHIVTLLTDDPALACASTRSLCTKILQPKSRSIVAHIIARLFRKPNRVKRHLVQSVLSNNDSYHVFRLDTLDQLVKLHSNVDFDKIHLDLDELDSNTHQLIALRAKANNDKRNEYRYSQLADQFARKEANLLTKVKSLSVSSSIEAALVSRAYNINRPTVFPNQFIYGKVQENSPPSDCINLLFVGTLGYYPNVDALEFFLDQIEPILTSQLQKKLVITVIGNGGSRKFKNRLKQDKRVTFLGYLPTLTEFYQSATLCICPIRAGGGTRIKLLEAAAHRLPIVSTSIGMQGLPLTSEHIYIAESPEEFAGAICTLAHDQLKAEALARECFIHLKQQRLILKQTLH